jgi:hypothetical protein
MVETEHIIAVIDSRLADLTKVRGLLSGRQYSDVTASSFIARPKAKRVISAQGRANIAAARRKRAKLAIQQIPIGGNSGLHKP